MADASVIDQPQVAPVAPLPAAPNPSIQAGLQGVRATPSVTGAMPAPYTQEEVGKKFEANRQKMEAIESEAGKAYAAVPEMKLPDSEFHPLPKKESSELFALLMVMGALGGRSTNAPMTAALNNMTGIMKGQMEGNKEMVAAQREQFKTNFDNAIKKYDAYNREKEAILRKYHYDMAAAQEELKSLQLQYGVDGKIATAAATQTHYEVMDKAKKQAADLGLTKIPQETIDFYAKQSLSGDNSWQVGLARGKVGQKLISAVKDRIPQLAKEQRMTPQDVSTSKATRDSLSASLRDRQKFVAASTQFISNFSKQANLVEKYLKPGIAGQTPVLNRWIQAGRKSVAGDEDVTKLDTAIRGLAREHQRIVTGVTSNAQLHVAAQETANQLLNVSQTESQVRGNLSVMREEAKNAQDAGNQEVEFLTDQLRHIGASAQTNPPAGIPAGSKVIGKTPDGKDVYQSPDGKKWVE